MNSPDFYEGHGGNCQAQTKLLVHALDKIYAPQLKPNEVLAVQQFSDHLQVVIYNKETGVVYSLIDDKTTKDIVGPIYDPKILAHGVVRELDFDEQVIDAQSLLLAKPNVPQDSKRNQYNYQVVNSGLSLPNVVDRNYSFGPIPANAIIQRGRNMVGQGGEGRISRGSDIVKFVATSKLRRRQDIRQDMAQKLTAIGGKPTILNSLFFSGDGKEVLFLDTEAEAQYFDLDPQQQAKFLNSMMKRQAKYLTKAPAQTLLLELFKNPAKLINLSQNDFNSLKSFSRLQGTILQGASNALVRSAGPNLIETAAQFGELEKKAVKRMSSIYKQERLFDELRKQTAKSISKNTQEWIVMIDRNPDPVAALDFIKYRLTRSSPLAVHNPGSNYAGTPEHSMEQYFAKHNFAFRQSDDDLPPLRVNLPHWSGNDGMGDAEVDLSFDTPSLGLGIKSYKADVYLQPALAMEVTKTLVMSDRALELWSPTINKEYLRIHSAKRWPQEKKKEYLKFLGSLSLRKNIYLDLRKKQPHIEANYQSVTCGGSIALPICDYISIDRDNPYGRRRTPKETRYIRKDLYNSLVDLP